MSADEPLARGESSSADLNELLAILDLRQVDDDTFVGSHPSRNPVRTFGGQMMAQSLVAATRSLKHDLPPSALSVHFIAGGDPEKDLEFHIARLRDERRFANRRVDVMQDGTLLTTAMVSYLSGGRSLEHGVEPPELPDPLTIPPIDDLLRGYEDVVPHFVNALRPIDWRYTNDPTWVMRAKGEKLTYNRVWMKAQGPMPDDPALHAAALVYASDTTVLDSIHHHARSVVGVRPHLRGQHEPFGVVPPSGAVRRLGSLFDVVAGGRGFTGPGHGALLQPVGSDRGDRRAGRHHQAFSALRRRRGDRHRELVFHVLGELLGTPLDGLLVRACPGQAVDVVGAADLAESPDEQPDDDDGLDDAQEAKDDAGDRDAAVVRLTAFRLTPPEEAENHRYDAEHDAADDAQQRDDRGHQRSDAQAVTGSARWRRVSGVERGRRG